MDGDDAEVSFMLMLLVPLLVHAQPQFERFEAPGFARPVSGVWHTQDTLKSPIPLGAMGTGFIEMTASGAFAAASVENDWLKPCPVSPESGFVIQVGGKEAGLFPGRAPVPGSRLWGHFPCADLDLSGACAPVRVYLRAFAPLVPHDYDASALPALFFKFTLTNGGEQPVPALIRLTWRSLPVSHEEAADGLLLNQGYAVGCYGAGWTARRETLEEGRVEAIGECTLAPGQATEVLFVLAWYFPEWDSSDGERLLHRYAAHYQDANDALESALKRGTAIERAITEWQERVYACDVPPMVQDALLNGLYILARNSWWLDDGRFFLSESFSGCPITETFVCRFNGSFPLALLWPECEKATMAEFMRTQADTGQIAFGFGAPLGTRTPMMDLQKPIVSTEFVLTCWRNHVLWNDDAYLRAVYPAMKKAMRYALTLDTDGDGLVNEAPGSDTGFPANQYYDVWPWWGTSAYTGSICLAALYAIEHAAKRTGDAGFALEIRAIRKRAENAFERLLWNGAYYRLYNDPAGNRKSDTLLANALCGQWFAYTCGLGNILPEKRIQSVVNGVLLSNDAVTPYGAVNGARADGAIDDSFPAHSAVITIGEVWNFCAMAAFAGRRDEALRLFEESYANIALRQGIPYNIPWSLKPDTGEISWGVHYYSNPCVWTLFQALQPETYASLQKTP